MSYQNRRNNRGRNPRKFYHKTKHPAHVVTYAKEGEHPERTIKRFLKKCKKEKVIEQVRKYDYYEKPSVKRKRARARRQAVLKKLNEQNKKT
jgi:ribosomal protein S21|tara:strand:+ start:1732 stop:2007 length:276 start_codon:yes stop_codon:yes gene_type:complete